MLGIEIHIPRPHGIRGFVWGFPQLCHISWTLSIPRQLGGRHRGRAAWPPKWSSHVCCSVRKVEHWSGGPTAVKSKTLGGRKGRHWKGEKTSGQRIGGLKDQWYFTTCQEFTPLTVTTATPSPYTHSPQPNQRIPLNCLVMATEVGSRDPPTTYLLQFPSQLFHPCPAPPEIWEVKWPKTTQYVKTEGMRNCIRNQCVWIWILAHHLTNLWPKGHYLACFPSLVCMMGIWIVPALLQSTKE